MLAFESEVDGDGGLGTGEGEGLDGFDILHSVWHGFFVMVASWVVVLASRFSGK